MKMQNAAPQHGKRHFNQNSYGNYSRYHHNYQYSQKYKKRYPHSDRTINLSKPCPYCGYGTGLVIIRDKIDKGFCKCGRCDAALYSLNEASQKQGLTHISESLKGYLPNGEVGR